MRNRREAHMFYLAREVGKICRCYCWKKCNFIMINEFKYGETLKIWSSPLSFSLYSTFNDEAIVGRRGAGGRGGCNLWLRQNLTPRKTACICWNKWLKQDHGKLQEDLSNVRKGRLLAECKVLANGKYLTSYNRALIILAISWAKEFNLVKKDMKWYKQKWCRGCLWRMTMQN